ncbi:MAG: hypothetical protein JWQ96_2222 [Segetibacter sp.]|nr:hypothetical protein [Segetibacter sp.]
MSIINPDAKLRIHNFSPDKGFPNNMKLPVLYYQNVLALNETSEQEVKDLFEKNGWSNFWTDSIKTEHHFHSNSHVAMAILKGNCMIQLGGEDGSIQKLTTGDVLLIPVGVAHKNVGESEDFLCLGAYPKGQDHDMKEGKMEEKGEAEEEIAKVELPDFDPIFGDKGPVKEHWHKVECVKVIETERQF